MKLKRLLYGTMGIVAVVCFFSCSSSKKIVYFQGLPSDSKLYEDASKYELQIAPGDNLFINVSTASSNPQAVAPYNAIDMTRGGGATNLAWVGYLVDENGNITFPSLGQIHVGGLTKHQAIELIQKGIGKDIIDPIVNIRFLNYKVSVMGEVARPGMYVIEDERVSIPEIIARAGDLTIYGKRNDVLICRISNGEKKFFTVDLTSPEIFFSENYYLQQNDIVYVKPNRSRIMGASYNPMISTYISIASFLVTITLLINTLRKN